MTITTQVGPARTALADSVAGEVRRPLRSARVAFALHFLRLCVALRRRFSMCPRFPLALPEEEKKKPQTTKLQGKGAQRTHRFRESFSGAAGIGLRARYTHFQHQRK